MPKNRIEIKSDCLLIKNKFKYNKYQRHNFIELHKRDFKPENEINICGLNHMNGPDKWLPNKCISLINDATNSGFGLNFAEKKSK